MTRIATSIWSNEAVWSATKLIDRRDVGLLRYLWRIWKGAGECDVLILNGALGWPDRYCDLLAALVAKLRVHRPWVILVDCTWETGSRALARKLPMLAWLWPKLSKWMISCLDHRKAIYCVLSSDEKKNFGENWGVDPARIYFTPFCHTLFDVVEEAAPEDYVFSGGNSLRDYPLLIKAFAKISQPLRIASSFRMDDLPANVLCRPLAHQAYMEELRRSDIVVVPLQPSQRSAGQQTYLNAMALGKLTIVNDVIGVRDYVKHGVTGLIVDSTPQAIADAVIWARDENNRAAVDHIRAAGRTAAREKFGLADYLLSIRRVAEEVA
ncbi:glycosyl transferase group 1 [Sphingobium chlorophenolicum L-1]|uniref:Glycosyl transferase group 1 n=1 Tax=Sphingobium chlorophenolicum L-1 TaxID=690566 RepID=F6EX01_SPHCR|nr:glycosyl transferase group 1 [Sphingobium chlorophenolicum L-1]